MTFRGRVHRGGHSKWSSPRGKWAPTTPKIWFRLQLHNGLQQIQGRCVEPELDLGPNFVFKPTSKNWRKLPQTAEQFFVVVIFVAGAGVKFCILGGEKPHQHGGGTRTRIVKRPLALLQYILRRSSERSAQSWEQDSAMVVWSPSPLTSDFTQVRAVTSLVQRMSFDAHPGQCSEVLQMEVVLPRDISCALRHETPGGHSMQRVLHFVWHSHCREQTVDLKLNTFSRYSTHSVRELACLDI